MAPATATAGPGTTAGTAPWSRLEGQVVLVTGASSGIGRDFCLDLARAGCRVVAAARRVDRLRSLCEEINASASAEEPRAMAVELDVATGGSTLEAAVQRAWDAFGRIDALVNNAGIRGGVHSPLDWPEDEWDKLIKTNLTGLWLVAKHVCRRMRDAKLKGSVINISSIAGLNRGHLPGSIGYASSKSAVHYATKLMALELGTYGIRVNTIAPGLFKSEITAPLLQKRWLNNVASKIVPLKEHGTTDPALTSLSIKELPGPAVGVPSTSDFSTADPLLSIPGSENEFKQDQRPLARGADFIRGGPANDWVESFRPPGLADFGGAESRFAEFEQIYNNTGTTFRPPLDGPPQRVLSGVLHSFLASGRAGVPFQPVPVPALGLSESDKQCIRDRSCIMARHILGDQPEEYIQAQVNTLLHSLDIDNQMRGPMHGPYPEMEEYWKQSQSALRSAPMHNAADKWVTEFGRQSNNPDDWAHSFEQQFGPNGWASEFEQHQSQMAMGQMGGANMANLAAMEQSRMLAQTLASNNDPKFQVSQGADRWVSEFSSEHNQGGQNENWIDEFSRLNVTDEWAEEFSGGGFGESSADPWADEFQEQLSASNQSTGASRGVYVFSEMNPYVGHPNPMQEGQELFRKGLLSEAVLALEAEVLKNPDNAEGWRLLGVTHAENDDDQQAIAAMMRAQEADPRNLEVLLALGVSHTNELEQGEALRYLYRWLQNHPKYGSIAPPQSTDTPYGPDVVRLFNEAAQMSPEDADVHIVLGVLYNLSREYDKAVASFKTALKLRPQDYSLWNKLGATQANSVQSADAVLAYQQALDLKPNYVRAWANMGISYANQGLYEDSIRYYVRAVAMNPKADNAWQYLRISLSNASRADMIAACDSRNLDALQKAFPL